MKPSDNLHRLNQSLTRGEKRYFKLQAALQHGDKAYLRLFEAIDRQPAYDEAALLKQFAGEPLTNNFPIAKKYLLDRILEALQQFSRYQESTSLLYGMFRQIQVLQKKGLFARPGAG